MSRLFRNREKIVIPGLGFLVGLTLAVLLGIFAPPGTIKDNMPGGMYSAEGLFDANGHNMGFYPSETQPDGSTFRWTAPHATVLFPYAAHMGRHAHVSLRLGGLAGDRPPIRVKVSLNGKPLPEITIGTEFQVWSAELDTRLNPNPYLHPAHIQLDIESTPYISPSDKRELGVAVDWAAVTPERSRLEIITEATLWGLALSAVLLVATRRFGAAWGLLYGAGALESFAVVQRIYTPVAIPPIVEVLIVGLAWFVAVTLGPRQRPIWGLGLAACTLWLALAGHVFTHWQLDDAYISYRYAWNLAHGHGLIYNLGETVEGYTNFLWTALAAGAIATGLPPAGFTLALNIALSIGLVAITYWFMEKLSGGNALWALLAAVLLAVDDSIITYGARGSGMEALLFAFLVALSAALLWGPSSKFKVQSSKSGWTLDGWRVGGGVVLALAALTRPEGLLVAVVFLAVMAVQNRLAGRHVWTDLLNTLVPFMLILVPYHLWRISFYGYPFPNTFYAKTGVTQAIVSRGVTYWRWFYAEHAVLMLLGIPALLFAALEGLPRLRSRVPALQNLSIERLTGIRTAFALIVAGMVLYVISVGGDYFPGWRFLVPVMAPIVILAVEAARCMFGLLPQRVPVRALAATALLCALAVGLWQQWFTGPYEGITEQTKLHSTYVDRWGSAGIWLREKTPADTVVAVKGAGAIAYYAQRPVLDAYGLNDLHIAHLQVEKMGSGRAGHDKTDPEYVLGKQPDYILELENYLSPLKRQFRTNYHYEKYSSPTGVEIEWWERNSLRR